MEDQITGTAAGDEGFSDFMSAFGDEVDYQTDSSTDEDITEDAQTEEDGNDAPAEDGETEESHEGDETPTEENPTPEGNEKPDTPAETFTIKVNKQDKTYTREEMIALAQQGADYDRVKQQRDESRQQLNEMQFFQQFKDHKDALDMLAMISESSKRPIDSLIDSLYMSMRRSDGMDEAAAKEALRADKLQRQVSKMENQTKQQETQKDTHVGRAQQEIAEFRQMYPDIPLTEELVDKLLPDVQSGMSIANAYRKQEDAKKDAEIAELQKQLNAERQNKKNRAKSPGSQTDSGGAKKRDAYDEFMEAFD